MLQFGGYVIQGRHIGVGVSGILQQAAQLLPVCSHGIVVMPVGSLGGFGHLPFGFGLDGFDFRFRRDTGSDHPVGHAAVAVEFFFPGKPLRAFIAAMVARSRVPQLLSDLLDMEKRRTVAAAHLRNGILVQGAQTGIVPGFCSVNVEPTFSVETV